MREYRDEFADHLLTYNEKYTKPSLNLLMDHPERKNFKLVSLKSVFETKEFEEIVSPTFFALGQDDNGQNHFANLAKMPHLLIGGSTGSGKSCFIQSLILNILYRTSPEDVRLVLIDPKRVEFSIFNNLPHLIVPKAITELEPTLNMLDWLLKEMEVRYGIFQEYFMRNIEEYNSSEEVESKELPKLPRIVVVIDEFADFMIMNKKEFESKITRLVQKARATGIYVVMATQRISVNVVTGVIKANFPSRIAFQTISAIDSQTIINSPEAENLNGRGDMYYSPNGEDALIRLQGYFVSDEEIKAVVADIKANNKSIYNEEIISTINKTKEVLEEEPKLTIEDADELLPEAVKLVIENGKVSFDLIQRKFKIGYNRIARLIDQMEELKFVSPSEDDKINSRKVLITMEEFNKIFPQK